MAPTMISVNATETVSQTDNTDAASANPIHNAAISQTFATGTSLSQPTSAAGPERSRRAFKRNRSYQPFGGFGEAPSPSWATRLIVAALSPSTPNQDCRWP